MTKEEVIEELRLAGGRRGCEWDKKKVEAILDKYVNSLKGGDATLTNAQSTQEHRTSIGSSAALIVLSAGAALFLFGCVSGGGTTTTSNGWQLQYSKNATLTQTATGFSVKFPSKDGVHYITKPASTTLGKMITATFTISNGTFKAVDGDTARVRLYFQECGDDMMATKGTTEFFRWWSNPQMVALREGEFVLWAPLNPMYWSSVWGAFGDKNVKAFNQAKANPCKVGLTFGSNLGFGHGVTGTGTMTLTNFVAK